MKILGKWLLPSVADFSSDSHIDIYIYENCGTTWESERTNFKTLYEKVCVVRFEGGRVVGVIKIA